MSSRSIHDGFDGASHEEIARRAFEIYVRTGREPGRCEHNWRQAEYELCQPAVTVGRRDPGHTPHDVDDHRQPGHGELNPIIPAVVTDRRTSRGRDDS